MTTKSDLAAAAEAAYSALAEAAARPSRKRALLALPAGFVPLSALSSVFAAILEVSAVSGGGALWLVHATQLQAQLHMCSTPLPSLNVADPPARVSVRRPQVVAAANAQMQGLLVSGGHSSVSLAELRVSISKLAAVQQDDLAGGITAIAARLADAFAANPAYDAAADLATFRTVSVFVF
jgi:hypothetical protein